jgi:hypothetical protein
MKCLSDTTKRELIQYVPFHYTGSGKQPDSIRFFQSANLPAIFTWVYKNMPRSDTIYTNDKFSDVINGGGILRLTRISFGTKLKL